MNSINTKSSKSTAPPVIIIIAVVVVVAVVVVTVVVFRDDAIPMNGANTLRKAPGLCIRAPSWNDEPILVLFLPTECGSWLERRRNQTLGHCQHGWHSEATRRSLLCLSPANRHVFLGNHHRICQKRPHASQIQSLLGALSPPTRGIAERRMTSIQSFERGQRSSCRWGSRLNLDDVSRQISAGRPIMQQMQRESRWFPRRSGSAQVGC